MTKPMTKMKPLRRARVILFALILAAAPVFALAAEGDRGFVTGFEDLPLMPGLTQVADAGTVFDTPSGRIVEAYANGRVAAQDVAAFYARTLPQLGWQRISDYRYRREGELLDLEIRAAGGDGSTAVRFYLAPNETP